MSSGLQITSADFNQVKQNLRPESEKAFDRQQRQERKKLLDKLNPCKTETLSAIALRISNLDVKELEFYLKDDFYNPEAQDATRCIVSSIAYLPRAGSEDYNQHIRSYINGLYRIGEDSVDGYAMLSNFDGIEGLFIVKSPQNPDVDNLEHEAIIGMYALNNLKHQIPNFAYIYGAFKCSPPIIDPNTKEVQSYCINNKNLVNYVIYENITPSIPLSAFIQDCTAQQWLQVYLQVLYAIRIASREYDFTHYDLHTANVLIKRLSTTTRIMYDNNLYLETDYLATIIDYGLCHVQINDQHFGRIGYTSFNIFYDRGWIWNDFYKLLMHSMSNAFDHKNQDVIRVGRRIFEFFNTTETLEEAINRQESGYFAFPYNSKTMQLNPDDYIGLVETLNEVNFLHTNMGSGSVYSCTSNCPVEADIYQQLGVSPKNPIPIPSNLIEFYNMKTYLNTKEYNEVSAKFNYELAIEDHIQRINQLAKLVYDRLKIVNPINLNYTNIEEILTNETLQRVKDNYIDYTWLVDKTDIIEYYKDVGIKIAQQYNDTPRVERLKEFWIEYLNSTEATVRRLETVNKSNDNYIRIMINTREYKQAASVNKMLRWYEEERIFVNYDRVIQLE